MFILSKFNKGITCSECVTVIKWPRAFRNLFVHLVCGTSIRERNHGPTVRIEFFSKFCPVVYKGYEVLWNKSRDLVFNKHSNDITFDSLPYNQGIFFSFSDDSVFFPIVPEMSKLCSEKFFILRKLQWVTSPFNHFK